MPPYKRLFFVLAIITLSTTLFVLLFRRIDNDNFENVRDSSHNLYDLSNYMDNNRKIKEVPGPQKTGDSSESGKVDDLVMGINGESLMGKMVNETLRAQLGKSTWYFLHVMASRYPQDPTTTEQKRTQSFLQLLAYLYPCGDCSHHFQKYIEKHPPNVDSRDNLEQWLCATHNVINKRLEKPLFDCSKVHEEYDCGCGPDLVRYKPNKS